MYSLVHHSLPSIDVGVTQLNLRSGKLAYDLERWLGNVWVSP